jgi:hypothetical protein
MIAELLTRLDGRPWYTMLDQSDGGHRLIEVAPAGSPGVRPAEIVFVKYQETRGPANAMGYASSYVDQLRAGYLDGDFKTLFLNQASNEASFTATLTGDTLAQDSFSVFRFLDSSKTSVFRFLNSSKIVAVIGYENRGAIDSAKKSAWSKLILSIPADTLTAMSTSATSRVEPFNLMGSLSSIKVHLGAIAAAEPDLADMARSLIDGIEELGRTERVQRFRLALGILGALIKLHYGGYLFSGAEADEFASEADACVQSFRQTPPLFHLSLSLLARILVTDPRQDSAKIDRGMRIAQYLWRLGHSIEASRAEEAMLSFLVGANRISSISSTLDAIECSEALLSPLREQTVLVARLVARLARIQLSGNNPDRTSLLEVLSRCDMMTYMLDCSLGGASDSSFSGLGSGKKTITDTDMSVRAMRAIQSCAPDMRLSDATPEENEYWGADRVPLSLLHVYAANVGVEAQRKLLGFDFEKQMRLSDLKNSQLEQKRPYVCLLRSFRSMRRLWVANAFQPDDPDIWPLITEPRLLTVEAIFTRALGTKFSFLTVGGGYDILGMGRINVSHGSAPVTEDSWKEHVQRVLDMSTYVLLQPDTTAGVEWEIGEISRRGMMDRTIIIMLPYSVDESAALRWGSLKQLDHQTTKVLPHYRPDGGLVFFQSQNHAFGVLPFSAVFGGELSQFLLTKSGGDRPVVSR